MNRIEPKNWFQCKFAVCKITSDLLRNPTECYSILSEAEKNKIRQTQIFVNEVVQVLGKQGIFLLIKKYDQSLGWIEEDRIETSNTIKNFIFPKSPFLQPNEFLKNWLGVKYVLGGVSEEGIDCSGLIQKYFFEVHGKIIPKNSRDQRKLCIIKDKQNLSSADLVFCHRIGSDLHHVVLYFENNYWHARSQFGVVNQNTQDFENLFEIECIGSLNI